MDATVSMRLPKGLLKAVDTIATRTERPKSYVMRKALEAYVAEHAEYRVALGRLRDKHDRAVPESEMRRRIARQP